MELKDWLLKKRLDPDEFAVANNIGISTIYRVLRGKKCRRKTARVIEKATAFEVPIEVLLRIGEKYEQPKQ